MLRLSLFSDRLQWLSLVSALRLLLAFFMLIYALGLWRGLAADTDPEDRFDELIIAAAARHALPPSLIKAVIRQESEFKPWAAGADGEIGLMQITRMAVTDWEGATDRLCPFNGMLTDPRLNIEIGSWYLSRAYDRWQGYRDVEVLALAQYNAGGSRAVQWAPGDVRESVIERISIESTRDYIKSVLNYREQYVKERIPEQ